MSHPCPECGTALAGKIYDGVTFSECPQCAGVWFFEEDLKHLESESVKDLDAVDLLEAPVKPVAAPAATLACPMCGGAMGQYHFLDDNPVVVHRCDACAGLWMEHGQLTEMAAAVEAAMKPPTEQELLAGNKGLTEALFEEQHAETMAHYKRITGVCRVLNYRIFSGFWL